MHVKRLLWDLSWDLVCTHRMLDFWFTIAKIGSKKDKWDRNSKPQYNESKECCKWNCSYKDKSKKIKIKKIKRGRKGKVENKGVITRGMLTPDKQV